MTILLLESLHPEAEAILERVAPIVRAQDPAAPQHDLPYGEIRAIVTRGRGRIPEALMARCPKLQIVSRAGAGVDNIDVEAARARQIEVVFARGANAMTVAEHTIALMLAAFREIPRYSRAVAEGRWNDRSGYNADELNGKTLGIVGYGAIGQRVATVAKALGMQVVAAAHDSLVIGCASLPLDDLLPQVDVLSLHVPLTNTTRHRIGAKELAALKRDALVVNTARGAILEPNALRAAVLENRIRFAADVYDPQPPIADDPLPRSPRVLLTPHIASLTATTYHTMCVRVANDISAQLARG